MTEEENSQEKVRQKRELVALSDTASAKLSRWMEQINSKKPVSLSRKAFLSWYIENAPDNLSNGEVNAAVENFYDTETHLRKLLREVRKAKANGQGDGGVDLVLRAKKIETRKDVNGEDLEKQSD